MRNRLGRTRLLKALLVGCLVASDMAPAAAQQPASSCDGCQPPPRLLPGTSAARKALLAPLQSPPQVDRGPRSVWREQCEDHLPRTLIVAGVLAGVAGYVLVLVLEDSPTLGSSDPPKGDRLKVAALSTAIGVATGALFCLGVTSDP